MMLFDIIGKIKDYLTGARSGEALQATIKLLETKVSILRDEIVSLSNDKVNLTNTVSMLASQLSESVTTAGDLERQNITLHTKVDHLKNMLNQLGTHPGSSMHVVDGDPYAGLNKR